jgi:pimeloyl-ACP methyl ester carboxylesterase
MHKTGMKIHVGGAALHVQIMGDASARPILFLHRGAGSLADFEYLLPELDQHCCVLLDLRGHGQSTLGRDTMSYPRLAADIEAVIGELDIDAPVLLGHADGGTAALEVAARGRAPISGIVTLAARAWRPSDQVIATHIGKATPSFWRSWFPEDVALFEAHNPEPDFDRFFGQVAGMWRNVADTNYPGPRVREIQCPTLVLGGEHDHLVSVDETLDLWRAVPNAHLGVLPYASHMVHCEEPDQVAPFVDDFMGFLDDDATPCTSGALDAVR